MVAAERRRLLSTGTRVAICVEPVLFGHSPDVVVTRAKVAQWCFQHLTSSVYEVSATQPFAWTIEAGTLEIMCLLKSDADVVRSFFNEEPPF